ncbi:hypothetical protein Ahy_A08g041151 isoform A [Arachis hypogaea]|uniref:RRM domain-containing protein n=1 Tax=Arachis hypogaea TaxID=3818 RepID=A0A445C1S0_ARAHY|nr:hypothetical protein Ahy_A08g041151 isoform A [Arachis hypogaea]
MRPVFAGNLEYDTRQSELERLFSKYGRIDRVDMKSGTFSKEKYVEVLSFGSPTSAIFLFGSEPSCLLALCIFIPDYSTLTYLITQHLTSIRMYIGDHQSINQ